jgi:hypothetical protein
MANTFTFKDHNPTGRFKSFDHVYVDIKLKSKICGTIYETDDGYIVRLMVKKDPDPNDPAGFKWIQLKGKHRTKMEAKTWVKDRTTIIAEKFDLFLAED